MSPPRDALATSSSSLSGGVGGGSKGIVLGDERAPTAEPASPRRLLARLAARRSPDKLTRRRFGVELRLLVRLTVRLSSGVFCWLRLTFDRLLRTLGDRGSETTRLLGLFSSSNEDLSAPAVSGVLTDLVDCFAPPLVAVGESSRMAFGVSVLLRALPERSAALMFEAAILRLCVPDSSGMVSSLGLNGPLADGESGILELSAAASIERESKKSSLSALGVGVGWAEPCVVSARLAGGDWNR